MVVLQFLKDYWEAIVSISALTISFISLRNAIVSSRRQKKHYINSVRPHLDLFITGLTLNEICRIEFKNLAIGPAIIKKVVMVDTVSKMQYYPLSFSSQYLSKIDPDVSSYLYTDGMMIGSNSSYGVFEIRVGKAGVEDLVKLFDRFHFRYEYTDLYDSHVWIGEDNIIGQARNQFLNHSHSIGFQKE